MKDIFRAADGTEWPCILSISGDPYSRDRKHIQLVVDMPLDEGLAFIDPTSMRVEGPYRVWSVE